MTKENFIWLMVGIVFLIQGMALIGCIYVDSNDVNTLESETDIIWVDFDVTGTIRVEVVDTNEGEVPDEAWEAARAIMGEFGNYASAKFKIRDYGTYTEVIPLSKKTNTDNNTYTVTVAGIVKGDTIEEAKEHFWEDICTEVVGEWCISEIKP